MVVHGVLVHFAHNVPELPESDQGREPEAHGQQGDHDYRVDLHRPVRVATAIDRVVGQEDLDGTLVARVVLFAAERLEERARDRGQEELGELELEVGCGVRRVRCTAEQRSDTQTEFPPLTSTQRRR